MIHSSLCVLEAFMLHLVTSMESLYTYVQSKIYATFFKITNLFSNLYCSIKHKNCSALKTIFKMKYLNSKPVWLLPRIILEIPFIRHLLALGEWPSHFHFSKSTSWYKEILPLICPPLEIMCRSIHDHLCSVDFVSESCTLTEQIQDYLTEELPWRR